MASLLDPRRRRLRQLPPRYTRDPSQRTYHLLPGLDWSLTSLARVSIDLLPLRSAGRRHGTRHYIEQYGREPAIGVEFEATGTSGWCIEASDSESLPRRA